MFLSSSLFGEALSSSSTASLVFLFAPIYAAIAQGIIYGVSKWYIDTSDVTRKISSIDKSLLFMPLIFLLILSIGIVKMSYEGIDSNVAQKATHPDTLNRLYTKSLNGEVDSFRVPFNLAQNPKTPTEILRSLSTYEHPAIRAQVARNTSTPIEVVTNLKDDTCLAVRNVANKR